MIFKKILDKHEKEWKGDRFEIEHNNSKEDLKNFDEYHKGWKDGVEYIEELLERALDEKIEVVEHICEFNINDTCKICGKHKRFIK